MSDVSVHLLPSLFHPSELAGGVAVMIDVLRASSTICTALANGATSVRPFADVDATRTYAEQHSCLTGGERGGVPIDGFHFGNSPASYSRERVEDHEICFTTTNGTQALVRMSEADVILVGAFLNRTALVDELAATRDSIHLVCAGTDGAITAEDVLFAGAVASDLNALAGHDVPELDQPLGTQLATALYRQCSEQSGGVEAAVRAGRGGQNLARLGLADDITGVMRESSLALVPRMVGDQIVARATR